MSSIPPVPRILIEQNGAPSLEFLRWLGLFRDTYNLDANGGIPVGSVMPSMGASDIGTAWLVLNGRAMRKSDYPALYALLSGSVAETSTTFTLPDMRNRTVMGAGAVPLLAQAGASSVTLTVAQLPAHDHPVTDPGHVHTVTDPGHVHAAIALAAGAAAGGAVNGAQAGNTAAAFTGISVNSATTGVTVGNRGSGAPIDITPPVLGLNWLVKT